MSDIYDYIEAGRRQARWEQDAGLVDHGLPDRDDDMDAVEWEAECARDRELMEADW